MAHKNRFDLILEMDEPPKPIESPIDMRRRGQHIRDENTRWLRLRQLEAIGRAGIQGTEGEQLDHLEVLSKFMRDYYLGVYPNYYESRSKNLVVLGFEPNHGEYFEPDESDRYTGYYTYDPEEDDYEQKDQRGHHLYGPVARCRRGADVNPYLEELKWWESRRSGSNTAEVCRREVKDWDDPSLELLLQRERLWALTNQINPQVITQLESQLERANREHRQDPDWYNSVVVRGTRYQP